MGLHRRDPVHGRRLYRPPVVRRGGGRPPAGGRGVSRGHRAAAQLARRPARLHQAGRAAALFRRHGGIDGLDGEPLHRQHPPAQQRRLHGGRQGGIPTRLRRHGIHSNSQTALSPRACGHRRHRGFVAAADALRLLERQPQTVGSHRQRRRPADVRHGRAGGATSGARPAQRIQRQTAAQDPPSRFPRRPRLCR